MMRIHTKAMALSCGIVFGFIIMMQTVAGYFFEYAPQYLEIIKDVYPGYSVTIVGSVIGLMYGFLSGGIFGGLIGVIYNRIFVRM